MKTPTRTFRGGKNGCQVGCSYCFASMPEYKSFPLLDDVDAAKVERGQLIYPICDSEILYNRQALKKLLKHVDSLPDAVSVSLSTKLHIPEGIMKELEVLNEILTSKGGLLKLAASASVFHSRDLHKYESGASGFEERLDNLSRAKARNISTSVTIKPVLPWIDIESYRSIVESSLPVTSNFAIGGLYLSEQTSFGKEVIAKYKDAVVRRQPTWLPKGNSWFYLEDKSQMQQIRASIKHLGAMYFDSDEALFVRLWQDQNIANEHANNGW